MLLVILKVLDLNIPLKFTNIAWFKRVYLYSSYKWKLITAYNTVYNNLYSQHSMYQNNQRWAVKFVLPFVFLTEISNNFFKQFSQRWTADIHFQSCPSDSRSWILQDLLQKSTNKVFVCTYSCWESHWVKTLPVLHTSQQLVSLLGLVK